MAQIKGMVYANDVRSMITTRLEQKEEREQKRIEKTENKRQQEKFKKQR